MLTAYSLGAFVEPLVREFGWTRAQVTAAAMFTTFGYLVAGSFVGGIADRYGARRVALISQVLLICGFVAMSQLTTQVWTLYAASFAIAVFGAGTLPITWTRTVTGWFVDGRGLALGLSLLGTGLVGSLLPSYVSWLVIHVGWRYAFAGVAALPLVIGIPLALLFFREPAEKKIAAAMMQSPANQATVNSRTFAQAIQTLCFWQMALSFFIAATTVSAVLIHTMPLLMDRGVPVSKAAGVLGLFGVAVATGRLISGYLLDIFRSPAVAAAIFLVSGLACGLLVAAGDNLILCGTAIILIGLSAGAESDVAAYLTAKYFGRLHYGAIYGLLYALYCIGAGVGPLIAGAVYDLTGSYRVALLFGLLSLLIAAALAALIRTPDKSATSLIPNRSDSVVSLKA